MKKRHEKYLKTQTPLIFTKDELMDILCPDDINVDLSLKEYQGTLHSYFWEDEGGSLEGLDGNERDVYDDEGSHDIKDVVLDPNRPGYFTAEFFANLFPNEDYGDVSEDDDGEMIPSKPIYVTGYLVKLPDDIEDIFGGDGYSFIIEGCKYE